MAIQAYSKAKEGNKRLSPDFKVSEFACQDGTDPVFVGEELVEVLQKLRSAVGKPVIITSGYRTVAHNRKVGGATYSQHLYGTAADIRVAGETPEKLSKIVENFLPASGGIGVYSWGIHVDTRKVKARWVG